MDFSSARAIEVAENIERDGRNLECACVCDRASGIETRHQAEALQNSCSSWSSAGTDEMVELAKVDDEYQQREGPSRAVKTDVDKSKYRMRAESKLMRADAVGKENRAIVKLEKKQMMLRRRGREAGNMRELKLGFCRVWIAGGAVANQASGGE
jgi:hypothetical protein